MKLLKYTFFLLISLLLSVQAIAQPDTRRMNISIGTFSASATSYDYEGAIGVVGSTGYDVDDIEPGDTFWDDLSRYRVDSVDVIVAGSTATVWVTDLYSAGAPQSGKGTLGKPSPKTGIQPLTENGSNFITEAQEAKIMTDNLNRLDSLGGDGDGIFTSLTRALGGELNLTSASEEDINIISNSGIISLGDPDDTNIKSKIIVDNDGEEVLIQGYTTKMGYYPSGFNSVYLQGEAVEMGDPEGDYNRTVLTINDSNEEIELDADMEIYLRTDGALKIGNTNSYYLPTGVAPTANQILSWPTPTTPAFTNWFTTSSSITNISSSGSASGNIISSGASSLPSSISQISGVDTSQINVQAINGLGLKATKWLTMDTDSIIFGDLLINRWGSGNLGMHNTAGRWDIYQKGSGGLLNVYAYGASAGDPIGMFVDGSTGELTLGDRDSDVHQGRLQFYSTGDFEVFSGNSMLSKLNNFITLGDEDGSRTKIVLDVNNNDDIETVRFIGGDASYYGELELNDNTEVGTIALGMDEGLSRQVGFELIDDSGNEFVTTTVGLADKSWGLTYLNDTGAETFDLTIGDHAGTKSGTKIALSNGDSEIVINANSGTTISGSGYTYDLPVTTPASADSLYRQMVWKQGEKGVFQINNGSNYRSAESSGNIFPYDDYVEVFPNVTVSLPAPSVGLVGKKFTLIGSGATSGGSPGTVDVVDGSSTIETGSSLTIDNAFEAYSLICNGSQWIILNNKP